MDELDLLLEDTRSLEIVALSADDSSLRTQFLRRISKHVSRRLGRQIHVLDFDLQFSSYMNNLVAIEGIGEDLDNQLLTILQPSESSIEESVIRLASSSDLRPGGIIILDSINTLQGMIRNRNQIRTQLSQITRQLYLDHHTSADSEILLKVTLDHKHHACATKGS